jgi:hypothetical protein
MAIELTRIGKLHIGLVGATSGVAYATHWVEPGSVLLGGAVMGANFYLLRAIAALVRPARRRDPARRGRVMLAVAAFVLKFALFMSLVAALFWHVPVEGWSFAVGVTLLLVACLAETARHELFDAREVG